LSAATSACPRAPPPASADTTSRSASSRRESTVTLAPSAASSIAVARPIPSDAPQTRAWRPVRSRSMAVSLQVWGVAPSGVPAKGLDHAGLQDAVVVALRRGEFARQEAALGGIGVVQAIEGHVFGIHQHGARGVLAVVAQGVAVAVEHLGGAALAHAQPRPDDHAAEGGQPPFVALATVVEGGHDSATDHSHRIAAPDRPKITVDSATRAGVASPVNAGSPVSR